MPVKRVVKLKGHSAVEALFERACKLLADCEADARKQLGGRLSASPGPWRCDREELVEYLRSIVRRCPREVSIAEFDRTVIEILDCYCNARLVPHELPAREARYLGRVGRYPDSTDDREIFVGCDVRFAPRHGPGGFLSVRPGGGNSILRHRDD